MKNIRNLVNKLMEWPRPDRRTTEEIVREIYNQGYEDYRKRYWRGKGMIKK